MPSCTDPVPSGHAEMLFLEHNGVYEMCPSTWTGIQRSQRRQPQTVQYTATSRTQEENSPCLSRVAGPVGGAAVGGLAQAIENQGHHLLLKPCHGGLEWGGGCSSLPVHTYSPYWT